MQAPQKHGLLYTAEQERHEPGVSLPSLQKFRRYNLDTIRLEPHFELGMMFPRKKWPQNKPLAAISSYEPVQPTFAQKMRKPTELFNQQTVK